MKWMKTLMMATMLLVEYTWRGIAGTALKGKLTKNMLKRVSTNILIWEVEQEYMSKKVSGKEPLHAIRINASCIRELAGLATEIKVGRAVFNGLYDSIRHPGAHNGPARISLAESSAQVFGIGMIIVLILSVLVSVYLSIMDGGRLGEFIFAWLLTAMIVELFIGKMVMMEVIECNENMAQSILKINDQLAEEIPVIGEARNRERITREVNDLRAESAIDIGSRKAVDAL